MMNVLYILLIPLFSLVVYKRINYIIKDLKENHYSKLRVDVFFLILILIILSLIVWAISLL